MDRTLVCEICMTDIGKFDDSKIFQPMQPGMFKPLAEGFSPPFPSEVDWEYFLCPVCGKRAMGWDAEMDGLTREDRLLTDTGFFNVPKEAPAPALAQPKTLAPPKAHKPRKGKPAGRGGR